MTEQEENAIPESDNTTVETAINDSENPAKAKAMEEFDWNAVGKKQNNYSIPKVIFFANSIPDQNDCGGQNNHNHE